MVIFIIDLNSLLLSVITNHKNSSHEQERRLHKWLMWIDSSVSIDCSSGIPGCLHKSVYLLNDDSSCCERVYEQRDELWFSSETTLTVSITTDMNDTDRSSASATRTNRLSITTEWTRGHLVEFNQDYYDSFVRE